jgi:hypothetical protein
MSNRQRRRRFLTSGGACALAALVLAASAGAALPDGRGWEMVSPPDKNGGRVDPPETIAKGGDLQAAAQGGLITYSSATSFAGGAGAPTASQYIATRTGSGWATQNITTPVLSGSYDFTDQGVPYRLFSADLSRALLLNGDPCRGEGASGCPVANPPLPGTDAPQGFQDYYLREGASFEALIGEGDVAGRGIDPAAFEVKLEGATPDLGAVVLSSCSPLAQGAIDGCGGAGPNLYLWKRATGALTLIASGGVLLAAGPGAISTDGDRVYFQGSAGGPLSLREGAATYPVSSGPATFQTASQDGTLAYYAEAEHLHRYSAATHTATDLTPLGGVKGVLGASPDGSAVYFQDAAGLKRWQEGTTTTIAAGPEAADSSAWPPATGASRLSADGQALLFPSQAKLTGYDNADKVTGLPDTELFLYGPGSPTPRCLSCNPKGKRPIGPSAIPGAWANGLSFAPYKPRALSANGRRVFFTSQDALVTSDSNSQPASGTGVPDVYQWEAAGEGSCKLAGGCLEILSNGALPQGATFADASADGSDAYFLTESSLIPADPGQLDLYDARVGGGFPEAAPQIPCEGDACQILPPVPPDPSLATLAKGAGNPAVVYHKYCRRGYYKHKGICLKKGTHEKSGKGHHKKHHAKKHHEKGARR